MEGGGGKGFSLIKMHLVKRNYRTKNSVEPLSRNNSSAFVKPNLK
ncbi:hypothetical protein ES707_10569 [subsurface metagenome]